LAEPLRTTWQGDPALQYGAGDLIVTVLPRRGGKLASIVHRGREWLTQPQRPLIDLADLPPTLVAGDMFGWDECAPTIDDCTILGRNLPLHGDAWDQPWQETDDGWLVVRGRHFDYTLGRRLGLRPDGFRLEYRVTAAERMPFLWAAHPQFAAGPDTQVIFGDGSPRLVDLFDRGYWRDRSPAAAIRLSDLPPGRSAKLFADPGRPVDTAQLIHADGAALRFRWDAGIAPYLGVWMDRGGIGPVDTIALEPMTGYADSCAAAARANRILWLDPDEPVTWWLDVSFSDERRASRQG